MILDKHCFEMVRLVAAQRGYPSHRVAYAGAYSDEQVRFTCRDHHSFNRRGGVLVLNSQFEVVNEEPLRLCGSIGMGDRLCRFSAHVHPDRREFTEFSVQEEK